VHHSLQYLFKHVHSNEQRARRPECETEKQTSYFCTYCWHA